MPRAGIFQLPRDDIQEMNENKQANWYLYPLNDPLMKQTLATNTSQQKQTQLKNTDHN